MNRISRIGLALLCFAVSCLVVFSPRPLLAADTGIFDSSRLPDPRNTRERDVTKSSSQEGQVDPEASTASSSQAGAIVRQAQPDEPLPLEEPVDENTYLCGAGDLFRLNFWGHQNNSHQFYVDASGKVFLPKVGYVRVADTLLKDALVSMRTAVARYYPKLNFDFSLVKPRSFLVHIVGAVTHPGIYVARPTERLTSLLIRAGGRSKPDEKGNGSGSIRMVEINRRNGDKFHADLLLYNLHGDVKNNPLLRDGDVVTVPFEALTANITGAVERPGRYELAETKDLAELVAIAGGLRTTATRQLPVVLSRRDLDTDRLSQVRIAFPAGGQLPSLGLRNGDEVHISSVDELQRSVLLVGAIHDATQTDEATSVKRLPYEQGDTVRTLLERAGGVGPGADYKNSFIVRGSGAGKSVIPLDLESLLVYRDMHADRPVQIGDVINVPFQRRAIMIEGAVMRPGVYQYNPRLSADDYIAIAGGPSKMAQDHDSFRLVSPKGKTELISSKTIVQPGDTIVVPERHFSRAEVTQIIISAVGLAITSTALIITATR